MKNGIAMIPNFSMPVNSFSATDSIGTVRHENRNVSTVRPSEIEIGMPVSISSEQQSENDCGAHRAIPPAPAPGASISMPSTWVSS